MLGELEHILEQYQVENQVCFEYDTELYFGHVV